MKRKKISQLIDASGVLGFEFSNDTEVHAWFVTLEDGEMIAKHVFERGGCSRNFFYSVPYISFDACNNLYDEIVLSFVECYALDLRSNSASSLGLFSDTASKGDDGLLELLSFFGVEYDEFLLDVFYWFGCWIDSVSTSKDGHIDYWRERYIFPDPDGADAHLVRKVLARLPSACVSYYYEDNTCETWNVVVAHGEAWFEHLVYENYDFRPCDYKEHGHILLSDDVGIASLRDSILRGLEDETLFNSGVTGEGILRKLQIGDVELASLRRE